MTAHKKNNTNKTPKSPAPATKSPRASRKNGAAAIIAPAPAPAAIVAAEPPPATAATASAEPSPAVAAAVLAEPPPATAAAALAAIVEPLIHPPKPVASRPVTTTVAGCIDVGFGNELYIRGEGAGLNWDKGVRMTCVANDCWQISLAESSRPIAFKFLINDVAWCSGPDFTVEPGTHALLTPQF
jgi:hypothetical protein